LYEFSEKQENTQINQPKLVNLISNHIQSLVDQFNCYFGDLKLFERRQFFVGFQSVYCKH